MRLIDKLETSRKVWKNVLVFDTAEEARDNGFRVLYHDDLCSGTVYGKPKDNCGLMWMPGVVFDVKEP